MTVRKLVFVSGLSLALVAGCSSNEQSDQTMNDEKSEQTEPDKEEKTKITRPIVKRTKKIALQMKIRIKMVRITNLMSHNKMLIQLWVKR